MIAVARENTGLKLALAIPTGTPITLVKEFLHLLQIKQLNTCQNNQKQQCVY